MARAVADVSQDRSARARLKTRHHPYWRSISEGHHLGYYRGKRAGSWIARCRAPGNTDCIIRRLGSAVDIAEADGEALLDWKQALEAALDWFQKVEKPGYLDAADLTVQTAGDEYSAMRDARDSARAGRPVRSDGRSRLTRYIKIDEKLASMCLYELAESDLKAWRARIQGLNILLPVSPPFRGDQCQKSAAAQRPEGAFMKKRAAPASHRGQLVRPRALRAPTRALANAR
jgi:hypothetical protein